MRAPLLLLLFSVTLSASAQHKNYALKDKLYRLQDFIRKGNRQSLEEIATYLDDTSFVPENLGYHYYPNTARGIAMRILRENCLFAKEEYQVDSSISTAGFLFFLNQEKIIFDELTGMFLLTPADKRETVYELKWLSPYDIDRVNKEVIQSPYPGWYYENQIDGFLVNKDPQALLWIAAAWFQRRSRFNDYYFQEEEFKNLIKKLTHLEVAVPDEKGEMTFLYEDDYYAIAKLNFLIYWARHYTEYEWNETKGFFENKKERPAAKIKEEILFPYLQSDNDSLALDAYMQLSESDTGIVKRLANEYEKRPLDRNNDLPGFVYRFLPKIAVLTQYCRDNNFTYHSTGWVKDSLEKLQQKLNFCNRYHLENNIISRLTLKDVTIIEYYGLVGGTEWDAAYSIGRILDKFYSLKLGELANDPKQLALFLKKAKLFGELGIIGSVNKYLRKFVNCPPDIIDKLKRLQANSDEPDLREQCRKALLLNADYVPYKSRPVKIWEGNNLSYGVNNLEQKYKSLAKKYPKKDDREKALQKLISHISYKQLGQAILLLQKDTGLDAYDRFHFIESDFGFDINLHDSLFIKDFLKNYSTRTEFQFYKYCLAQTGMNCFDSSGAFYYSGIYDILKYGIVDGFAGGGGGRRDDGVYLIIKLLELHFNTTLGFPNKRCNWQGVYYCDCTDSAAAWMHYLKEKGLVVTDKTESVSISPNK